jgi:hypothetical protein
MLISKCPAGNHISERRHWTQPAIEVEELPKTLDEVMIFEGLILLSEFDILSALVSALVIDWSGSYLPKPQK